MTALSRALLTRCGCMLVVSQNSVAWSQKSNADLLNLQYLLSEGRIKVKSCPAIGPVFDKLDHGRRPCSRQLRFRPRRIGNFHLLPPPVGINLPVCHFSVLSSLSNGLRYRTNRNMFPLLGVLHALFPSLIKNVIAPVLCGTQRKTLESRINRGCPSRGKNSGDDSEGRLFCRLRKWGW